MKGPLSGQGGYSWLLTIHDTESYMICTDTHFAHLHDAASPLTSGLCRGEGGS